MATADSLRGWVSQNSGNSLVARPNFTMGQEPPARGPLTQRPNFTIPETPEPAVPRNPANQQVARFTPSVEPQTPRVSPSAATDAIPKNDAARRFGYNAGKATVNGLRVAAEFAGPALAVGEGGYQLAKGATNQLDSLSDDNLGMMTNAGGGDDTALAAAILQQGRATTAAQANAPYTPSANAFNPKARLLRQGATPLEDTSNTIDVRRQANGNLSFSGKDIKEGADYSGPEAAGLRGKGMVMSMPAANFVGTSPSSDAALSQARLAAAQRGDWEAVNNSLRMQGRETIGGTAGAGGGAGGGMDVDRLMSLASQPVGTPGRAAAKLALQQQMSNDGSLRVAKMQQDTTLQSKKWELEVAQAQRDAVAKASKAAGNDPAKTAEILSNAGYVDAAKHFSDMANQAMNREKDAQGLFAGASAAADKDFEHQAVSVDKDGKGYIDPAKTAVTRNVRENLAPGYALMPADKQKELMPKVDAGINVVNGMNELRSNDLLQSIGWDPASPAMTTLPSLRGAQVSEVGLLKGMLKGGGVSRGDYQVEMPDGTVHYVPRSKVGNNELELLKAQGAKFNK